MTLIPFSWMPGSWGLKGKTRDRARAEYECSDPYELDKRILQIDHGDDEKAMKLGNLDIDLKHSKIDQYEYDTLIAAVNNVDETESALAKLLVDLDHKRISPEEYDKQRANILKEPWVSMPKINWDPTHNNRTYFEIDYNEYFTAQLREHGYVGEDDHILALWMNDVCSSIAHETEPENQDFVSRNDG